MKNIFLLTILLSGMLSAEEKATPPAAAPASPEFKTDGRWKPIAAVLGGVRLPKAELDKITLTLAGADYEVVVEGETKIDKGTCTVDATTYPKRMTIKGTTGPNAGKTILAIFEMKNAGAMRVCYDLSGAEFPKEFIAPKGTQLYLAGYRKAP